ncbi:MAG TPA: hypothetical protein VGL02_27370 [Streptomyces sp.]
MLDTTNPAVQQAVTEILDRRVDEIRAKARADHADELDVAGHHEAAAWLRDHQ